MPMPVTALWIAVVPDRFEPAQVEPEQIEPEQIELAAAKALPPSVRRSAPGRPELPVPRALGCPT
jgi:hypothetical protein